MVLVCQPAWSATRRSETTPKGSYPPIRFRVQHAEDGLSAFGCEATQDVVEPRSGDAGAVRLPELSWCSQLTSVCGFLRLAPGRVRLRAGHERAGEEVGWAGPAERLARSLVDLDGD